MGQFETFLKDFKNKKVAVIGVGVSNVPLIRLLCASGAEVTAHDKKSREALGETARELENLGVTLRLGDSYLEEVKGDVIFRTPGLRPDVPALLAAFSRGARITSEMEAFFEVCPCPILAVTGSDGKTTTTTLVSEMLKAAGKTVYVGGNIGMPLLDQAGKMKESDLCVLELSSFQLMTMRKSPRRAAITNLSRNHLDVHRSYEEYKESKQNIFLYQKPEDWLVLNHDCPESALFDKKAPGRVLYFSRLGRVADGAYLSDDGWLTDTEAGKLVKRSDIRLPGEHNVENYLAASCLVRGLAGPEEIDKVAESFAGVEHRLELVRELDGVRYYNDAIATTPTRAVAGMKCFTEPIVLIAGGYDKHIPFDQFGQEVAKRVRVLVLCGATSDKIEAAVKAAGGGPRIIRLERFDDAAGTAREAAGPGQVVLFSPACASFDMFPNFMKKGEAFKEQVRSL